VITADRIEAIGAANLKDALGYTPGVSTTTYGADSRYDWISLRGFDAYSPGFYLDGLPLRNNSTWGVWRTENYGAERIELLRGPSSVLYGMSGPGGVVNVVSKRPTAEPVRELQVQLGDHNRKQVAGDFSGALDAEGKVLYRITGVLRDAQLPAAKEADDHSYIAPSLTWKPSATPRSRCCRSSAARAAACTPARGRRSARWSRPRSAATSRRTCSRASPASTASTRTSRWSATSSSTASTTPGRCGRTRATPTRSSTTRARSSRALPR
jgi:iron complex outermembrane receptor protein